MNKVTGDKQQAGIATQETWVPHQNSVKRGMGCEQLPSPKGNNHPCRHEGTGDKQQLGVGAPRTYDSDQIRTKSGLGCCPHTSPKGHNHDLCTEMLETNSDQVLSIEPVTHIKVQRKEWAAVPSPVPKRTTIRSHTGDWRQGAVMCSYPGSWSPQTDFTSIGEEQVPQATLVFVQHEILHKMFHLPSHCFPCDFLTINVILSYFFWQSKSSC